MHKNVIWNVFSIGKKKKKKKKERKNKLYHKIQSLTGCLTKTHEFSEASFI